MDNQEQTLAPKPIVWLQRMALTIVLILLGVLSQPRQTVTLHLPPTSDRNPPNFKIQTAMFETSISFPNEIESAMTGNPQLIGVSQKEPAKLYFRCKHLRGKTDLIVTLNDQGKRRDVFLEITCQINPTYRYVVAPPP